jgi:hypothetical protein
MKEFWDSRDPEVAKLVDWIQNEPRRGSPFGVSDRVYSFYLSWLHQLIGRLEDG